MLSKVFDYSEENGLVYCENISEAKNNSELLNINEAQKLLVDAILFRRFFKQGEAIPYHSEPAVYIFKKNNSFFNTQEHLELHAALWSAGKTEVYIILSSNRIDVINARKPAVVNEAVGLSIEDLILVSTTAIEMFNDHRFSAHLFSNGTFWEQGDFYDKSNDECFFRNKLEEENMPYHQLLTFLKQTRKELATKKLLQLTSETIDKLLIISILIKFLEEIKDGDGSHTLTKIYAKYEVSNFAEALHLGKAIDILEELGTKLNGKIFDYFTDKNDGEADAEFDQRNNEIKSQLKTADLSPVANLLLVRLNKITGELEFDVLSKQLKLDFDFSWQQYSFRHLPIELISSIYEHFLQEDAKEKKGAVEKGVVYTPPFLVNFLIDEILPLSTPEIFKDKMFRILDPSCGSGVFLVSVYKRLLQYWVLNYYNDRNVLPEKLDPRVFQEILEDNIFGVDISRKATLITIFSLTISFLDKLTPIAFWENLDFNKLQDNIQTINFFEWASCSSRKFELVVGNPPFNIESGRKKSDVLQAKYLAAINFKHKTLPKNNFALHFFEASMTLAKKVCLIIPSNVLLYNKASQRYRNILFSDYKIETIFDFTHLREILFTKKNQAGENNKKTGRTPVVALIAESEPTDNKPIEHVVVKRINVTEKKLRFEIDLYDRHRVKWEWAVDDKRQFIWKTNLLGGGRLINLVYRLSLLPTLQDFIDLRKRGNPEWTYSCGYKIGGSGTKKIRAEYLHEKQTLDTSKKFDEANHCFSHITEVAHEFEAPRGKVLYSPPVLIISEVLGTKKIPMQFFDTYQPFNISFIGIHAPESEREDLLQIYNRLYNSEEHSSLYRGYMLLTSPKLLINKETAFIKEDIDSLPYPENLDSLILSEEERIVLDDVLKYGVHYGKSIGLKGAGKILHQKVDTNQLIEFGLVFCNTLNSIYARNGKSWQQGVTYQFTELSICQFGFGIAGGLKEVIFDYPNQLRQLIEDKISNSAVTYTRVIRLYKHINGYDCIFLIKPRAHRYWLNSVALKDADDTFLELKKAGF